MQRGMNLAALFAGMRHDLADERADARLLL
jgi:hypothetical protein